jgi:hypothetical protein
MADESGLEDLQIQLQLMNWNTPQRKGKVNFTYSVGFQKTILPPAGMLWSAIVEYWKELKGVLPLALPLQESGIFPLRKGCLIVGAS